MINNDMLPLRTLKKNKNKMVRMLVDVLTIMSCGFMTYVFNTCPKYGTYPMDSGFRS